MKKLFGLLFLLSALLALSLAVWKMSRPETVANRPFSGINLKEVQRLKVTSFAGEVTLDRTDKGWRLRAPMEDEAEAFVLESLMDNLENFTIGSPVSEKSEKYPEFGLDANEATHVEVYLQGKTDPVRNFYIGKQAINFRSAFYRVDGSTPVYVGSGLIASQWRRTPNAYRKSVLLPESIYDATSITVTQGKNTFTVKKASDVWVLEGAKVSDPEWAAHVVARAETLTASDFGDGKETAAVLGFSPPLLTIHVEHPKGPVTLEIGKKAPLAFAQGQETYFARVYDRPVVLKIRADMVNAFLEHLKTRKS